MHNLVIAALQERGVDRRKRFVAFRRETGCEGHGVLFGNTHIKTALRKSLGEQIQARCRTASPR